MLCGRPNRAGSAANCSRISLRRKNAPPTGEAQPDLWLLVFGTSLNQDLSLRIHRSARVSIGRGPVPGGYGEGGEARGYHLFGDRAGRRRAADHHGRRRTAMSHRLSNPGHRQSKTRLLRSCNTAQSVSSIWRRKLAAPPIRRPGNECSATPTPLCPTRSKRGAH